MFRTAGRLRDIRGRRAHPFLGRQPGEPAQHPRQAVHRVLLRLSFALSPPGAVGEEKFEKYGAEDDLSTTCSSTARRHGDRAVDLSQGFLQERLQHHRAQRGDGEEAIRTASSSTAPSIRAMATRASRYIHFREDLRHQGRQALHRRMERRIQGLQAHRQGGLQILRAGEKLGIKNMHVHKGPTIIPLNKDAFDVHDVDYAATVPEPELHRRALRPAAA